MEIPDSYDQCEPGIKDWLTIFFISRNATFYLELQIRGVIILGEYLWLICGLHVETIIRPYRNQASEDNLKA
jgi:hypothetical protein